MKMDNFKYLIKYLKYRWCEYLQCRRSPTITLDDWLKHNPEALASVKRGLAESDDGVYLGSFAKYVDLEIDDNNEGI